MIKRMLILVFGGGIAIAALSYSTLFIKNNFPNQPVEKEKILAAKDKAITWLTDNQSSILESHNPALWEMLAKTAVHSNSPELLKILRQYRSRNIVRYRGHPLEFQVYGSGYPDYKKTELIGFPYYNLLMMYGFSCDPFLRQLAIVEDQMSKTFCEEFYPISPACKTHQLMGFMILKNSQCEDQQLVRENIDHLSVSIEHQLWWDVRVVDVYLQRVMMLYEAGKIEKIRNRWIANIIRYQNDDGGWDGSFMPLFKIMPGEYFGLGSKFFRLAESESDFHATVQGALLLAYSLQN